MNYKANHANNKIIKALEEIIPSDKWELRGIKKMKDYYVVYAEDNRYNYTIELKLREVKGEEDEEARFYFYKLLDFSYEEKRGRKK